MRLVLLMAVAKIHVTSKAPYILFVQTETTVYIHVVLFVFVYEVLYLYVYFYTMRPITLQSLIPRHIKIDADQ